MKRCSIILPAYNVEAYVGQAIESALSQTYGNVEVVVVNDGSTDGTADVVGRYRERIRYVEQENRGLAGARNRALDEATGEFIALLDGDDVYLPAKVETLIGYLERRPDSGFVTSDCYMMYGDSRSAYRYYSYQRFPEDDHLYRILDANFINGMAVIRRDLFERHGRFDQRLRRSEDWDQWIRFLWGGERVGFVDQPLCYYRSRPDSLGKDPVALTRSDLAVIRKFLARPDARSDPRLEHVIYRWARRAAAIEDHRTTSWLWLQLARHPGVSWHRRLKALLGAAAPGLSGRHLYLRERGRARP